MISDVRDNRVLLDTGPLVALLHYKDSDQALCLDTFRKIRPPLITCWPVLTEAAWLLRKVPHSIERLHDSQTSGLFTILPLEEDSLLQISRLAAKYHNLRPQLADLTVLHLAECHNIDSIFTLDRRDFSVFRRKGGMSFRLLPDTL